MASFKYSIRVEPERNVVYMTQSGRPQARDFRALLEELSEATTRLQPGFTLVNDQRYLEPFDEDAMSVAKELVNVVDRAGLSKVIRIVPSDLVSQTKILRALVTGESSYQTVRVSSPAEAEKHISGELG